MNTSTVFTVSLSRYKLTLCLSSESIIIPPKIYTPTKVSPKNARFADNQAISENNSVFSDAKRKQGVNLRKLHRRAEKWLAVGVAGRCEPQRRS